MSNIFEQIGHGVEVAAKDVAHVAVEVVDFLPHALKLLDDAIAHEAEVKTLVVDLVKQATAVLTAGTVAVTDKGVDLTADAATLAAAEGFFAYFRGTFLPAAEALYAQLEADVDGASAS
ncbi:hypothetical protein ACFQBQ_02320 [Granulicella cerasi]|uniref:Uncharacterized protein n=1 Tax=Granulicella cerasi TaxID=741063 RepID=A0ABW1Z6Z4_9BACT|nr:hypothetical protein [Granulicella cerasi]